MGIELGFFLVSVRGFEVGRERGLVEVEVMIFVVCEFVVWKEGKKEEGKMSFVICVE